VKIENYNYTVAKPCRGFIVREGVKGEDTGGDVLLPLGARGLCPRKIFQITDAYR
jgi:hypothetical protein